MHFKHVLTAVLTLLAADAFGQGQEVAKPLVPRDPIDSIIDAFSSYRVVALGEGSHGNEQSHAFRLALIRDPRFAATVNDIVVEFGSGAYQDVVDRFIEGENVEAKELRQIWQNTSIDGTLWDKPIYEEFYRAVRDLNSRLPKQRQLRVLLADAPIDWDRIHSWTDYVKHSRTDAYPADLVRREVIAKGRRALIVYGEAHFHRKKAYWQLKDIAAADTRFAEPVRSIVALIERSGTKVFSVATPLFVDWSTFQPDVANWTAPKLARLQGTTIGALPYTRFYGGDLYIMIDDEKGIEERVQADPNRTPSIQEQFDAVLYLGPRSTLTTSKLPPQLCRDPDYMSMRLKRIQMGSPPDWKNVGASLKEYCASVLRE